mgnify:CR=1 FL=1
MRSLEHSSHGWFRICKGKRASEEDRPQRKKKKLDSVGKSMKKHGGGGRSCCVCAVCAGNGKDGWKGPSQRRAYRSASLGPRNSKATVCDTQILFSRLYVPQAPISLP